MFSAHFPLVYFELKMMENVAEMRPTSLLISLLSNGYHISIVWYAVDIFSKPAKGINLGQ